MKTFELKRLPSFKLIGVELRTTNAEARAMQEIPLFWERFIRERTFEAIPAQISPGKIYAVYTDYDLNIKDITKEGFYSLIIGAEVASIDAVPSGFVGKEVFAEKHAVLKMNGQVAKVVPEAWKAVWSSSFPYQRKFTYDFEIYNMQSSVDAEREVSLCISVI
jgi:predicted transcriptional regulator YdeE